MSRLKDGEQKDLYVALVREFPLESLRSEADLRVAQRMVESVLRRGPLNAGQERYLEALTDLILVYENKHCELPDATPREVLEYLMQEREITAAQLARDTKIQPSVVSEILAQKRQISPKNMRTLGNYFHVNPSVFLGGA